MRRLILITLCVLLYSIRVWAACSGSSPTYTAASSSYADVQACNALVVNGDTINIPTGSSTWSSTLAITKAISLIGNGVANTIITNGGVSPQISITGFSADSAVRITGIYFDNGSSSSNNSIRITGKTSAGTGQELTQVRIDHNTFKRGGRQLSIIGWVYGLADHDTFLDGNIAFNCQGDDNFAWGRAVAAGTANSFFVEDSTFTMTNAYDSNEQIYHQEGCRSVVRYNNFNATARTATDALILDTHGTQIYWQNNNSTDFRGQPIIEFYNNVIDIHHSYRYSNLRGGSILAHDNTFTFTSGSAPPLWQLTEEEDWQSSFFSPLRTAWPAQDQINNSFFWNNTRNGTAVTTVTLGNGNDSTFIQEGRDYWNAAPAASGGKESYTGSRSGGSTTAPTTGDTGSMSFSGAGANAYFPYTPYTYPHPFQAAPDVTPPVVTITSPTSDPTYSTSSTPLSVGGTCTDSESAVVLVTWVNAAGGSGTATGTNTWTANVAMTSGSNTITVPCVDAPGNSANDVITVTYTPPQAPGGSSTTFPRGVLPFRPGGQE